jgi:hypothetical protein
VPSRTLPAKFARTLAVHHWAANSDRDPAEVAREWVNARPEER